VGLNIEDYEKIIIHLQNRLGKAIVFKFTEGRLPITVESRGDGLWAVCDPGFCLNRDGEFEAESLPSNRTEDFIERTRFSFDEAWERAEKVAKERGA